MTDHKKLKDQLQEPDELLLRIDTLNMLGWDYYNNEDYNKALETGQKAYALSESINISRPYQKGIAESLALMGAVNQRLGKFNLCIPQFINAITILEKMPQSIPLADALSGMAWCQFSIGNYPEAQAYITRALNISEALQDNQRQIRFRNSLGAILDETGNFKLAVDVFHQALKIAEEHKEIPVSEKAITLNNLAIAYKEVGQFETALNFGKQSLTLIQGKNQNVHKSAIQDTLGQIYLDMQDYQKAIEHFNIAIELSNQIGAQDAKDESLVNLGKAYRALGQIDLAIQYCLAAEEIFKRSNNSRIAYHSHELLSSLYEEKGDLVKSLYYYKLFHSVKEAVFNHQSLQKIADMATIHRIETAQKDAEILRLKNIALQQEILSQKIIQEELEKLAAIDTLTKLFNRRYFFLFAEEKISHAQKNKKPLHLLIIDIDHFKQFNDNYGHVAGDHLIALIADVLQNNIRPNDLCCRYGGDEFVIMLPDMAEDACIQVSERLRHLVEETRLETTDENRHVSVSIGIAKSDIQDTSIEDLINKADQALYRAKRLGGNRISK